MLNEFISCAQHQHQHLKSVTIQIVLTHAHFVVQKSDYSEADVSVGWSDWKATVLADEAVFILARLVIPPVTVFLQQIDTCLFSIMIVRLNRFVPVRVAHGMLSEVGVMWDYVVICRFPYKLGLRFGVFPLSCRPYVDSVRSTSFTSRPLVICKHSKSTLGQWQF